MDPARAGDPLGRRAEGRAHGVGPLREVVVLEPAAGTAAGQHEDAGRGEAERKRGNPEPGHVASVADGRDGTVAG